MHVSGAKMASIGRRLSAGLAYAARPWRRWRQSAIGLVYPAQCLQCDADLPSQAAVLFCDSCRERIGPTQWVGCPRCAGRTPAATWAVEGCPLCRGSRWHFDGIVVLGGYQDLLREAILRTKRPRGEPWADSLARLLAERRRAELEQFRPDAIVPTPMHWRRRLARGVDGPQVLAERLGRELRVACLAGALRRQRSTRLQRAVPPQERARNVRGAFAMSRFPLARLAARLHGARVALVDDILTTGATADEIAKTLKRAGAAAVLAVVVARADGNDPGA